MPIEIDNGAVGFDSARSNVDYVLTLLEKGDFDVGVFAPLFGEDLDADVVVLMRSVPVVVAVDLAVQDDGGRSRSQGLARHLQFFW